MARAFKPRHSDRWGLTSHPRGPRLGIPSAAGLTALYSGTVDSAAGTGAHSATAGGATRQCEGKTDTEVGAAVGHMSGLSDLEQRELWEWVVDAEEQSIGSGVAAATIATDSA